MKRISWIIPSWLLLILPVQADTLTSEPSVKSQSNRPFNVTCPAKTLLPQLDTAYHDCSNGYGGSESCESFVETYKKLLPKYDCQYTDDSGNEWNVPALFMRRSPGATEDYTRLLWRLSSAKEPNLSEERIPKAVTEARILFTSKEFRNILDGDLAETFLDRSKQIERQLQRTKKGVGKTPSNSNK